MTGPSNLKALTLGLCVVMAGACQAAERSKRHQSGTSSSNASATLTPCRDCPEFVLAPPPPTDLRKIRYVAKYELTWKNFLASVDARACPVPSVEIQDAGTRPKRYVQIDPADYRIDWPISQLTPADLECYRQWLQSKTKYKVALPSAKEWEWFARAGDPDARFPWGNDANAGHEQLYGTPVDEGDIAGPAKRGIWLPGYRVGRFAPNAWGIHDLMGNVRELTADVVSGEEWARRWPNNPPSMPKKPHAVIKGSDAWDRQWASDGIARNLYTMILDGRYATQVGARLVLIEGDKIQ